MFNSPGWPYIIGSTYIIGYSSMVGFGVGFAAGYTLSSKISQVFYSKKPVSSHHPLWMTIGIPGGVGAVTGMGLATIFYQISSRYFLAKT